ncbi:MAG: PAS domain S-box protein [Actinobacteria bacterium]|nr:PAS domain S-box protein [Actinomycetota bacterium]
MNEKPPGPPEQQHIDKLDELPKWAETVIDNFIDAVVIVNTEGKFLLWNEKALEMAEYTSDEFSSATFTNFFDGDTVDEPAEVLRKTIQDGYTQTRLRVVLKSGRVNNLDVRCRAIKDDEGNVIAVTGVARDISDQVEYEEYITAQRDLAYKMSGSGDLGEILESALETLLGALRLPSGAIHVFDKKTGDLNLLCHKGYSDKLTGAIESYKGSGPAATMVQTGSPLFAKYEDVTAVLGTSGNPDGFKGVGVIPIKHQDEVLGSISIASKTEDEIPERLRSIIGPFLEIIGQGISRIKLAEELRTSEERYRMFYNHSGVAIFTADMSLRITDINREACELLGRSKEEVVGKRFDEAAAIIHPDDLGKALAALAELFGSGDPVMHIELRYIRKDGTTGFAEVSTAIQHKEGKMVGITNIVKDVTGRKQAEDVIRHSEEMFRQMFNYMSSGVAIYEGSEDEQEFRFKDINKAGERINNLVRSEVIGKPVREVFPLVEEYGLYRILRDVWEKGEPRYHPPAPYKNNRIEVWRDDYVYKLPSGEIVDIYDDLTEQRNAEDTIKKNAEDLKNLLDVAAHELRHPVAIFKGYSDMLRNHWKSLDQKAIREALDNIETASNRLSGLVTELLDLSRIENNKLELVLSRMKLSFSIKRATEEMRVRGFSNLFSVSVPDDEIEIYADYDKITKVFLVLLDNAIRYSGEGSPVDIWLKQNGEEVVCYIADRGPGVSRSEEEIIFNRFYQGESIMHHSTTGIGLGLYIARSIVESHGGRIGVEPRDGGGSIFYFAIPGTAAKTGEVAR